MIPWWMYGIITIAVFVILCFLHFLVKKLNDNRLEQRYNEMFCKKTPVSTQVQSPLIEMAAKKPDIDTANTDESKIISMVFDRKLNLRPTSASATTCYVEDKKMKCLYNKGISFTSTDNFRRQSDSVKNEEPQTVEGPSTIGLTTNPRRGNSKPSLRFLSTVSSKSLITIDTFNTVKSPSLVTESETKENKSNIFYPQFLGTIYTAKSAISDLDLSINIDPKEGNQIQTLAKTKNIEETRFIINPETVAVPSNIDNAKYLENPNNKVFTDTVMESTSKPFENDKDITVYFNFKHNTPDNTATTNQVKQHTADVVPTHSNSVSKYTPKIVTFNKLSIRSFLPLAIDIPKKLSVIRESLTGVTKSSIVIKPSSDSAIPSKVTPESEGSTKLATSECTLKYMYKFKPEALRFKYMLQSLLSNEDNESITFNEEKIAIVVNKLKLQESPDKKNENPDKDNKSPDKDNENPDKDNDNPGTSSSFDCNYV